MRPRIPAPVGQTIAGCKILEEIPKRGKIRYVHVIRACGHEGDIPLAQIANRPRCMKCRKFKQTRPSMLTNSDVHRYQQGQIGLPDIAKYYAVSLGTATKWMRQRGITPSRKRKSAIVIMNDVKKIIANIPADADERWVMIARRVAAGHTLQQIADDFGVSKQAIDQVVKKIVWRGSPVKKLGRPTVLLRTATSKIETAVRKFKSADWTYDDVAEFLKCSHSTARKLMRPYRSQANPCCRPGRRPGRKGEVTK